MNKTHTYVYTNQWTREKSKLAGRKADFLERDELEHKYYCLLVKKAPDGKENIYYCVNEAISHTQATNTIPMHSFHI